MIIIFQKLGEKTDAWRHSIIIFFQFLGHLCFSAAIDIFNAKIVWRTTFLETIQIGARLVLPLMAFSMLLGLSITLSIQLMLARLNLQNQALFIAQNIMIHDLLPLLISIVLCAQSAFNLIDAHAPSLRRSISKVISETIFPLIIGANVTALLLYAYIAAAFFASIYVTFHYLLHANTTEFLLHLTDTINIKDIVFSIGKTLCYTTIASLTAGYYYYEVGLRRMSMRLAVSRIMIRGIFWLILASGLNTLYFS